MKKILLLTDFSKLHKTASKLAINLCSQLNLDLMIMNNYDALPVIPFSDGGSSNMAWSSLYANTEVEISAQAKKIREEVNKMPSSLYKPMVHSLITEGDIGLRVAEIIPREDIELVIMGAGKGGSFDHLLFGNVAQSVIRNANCPVFVVPEKRLIKKINSVVFATNFNDQDLNAFKYVVKLGELLGFSIEVVHVHDPKNINEQENQREIQFIKQLEDFSYLNIRYTHLVGEKIIEKINQLCKKEHGDCLAMVSHPRTLLMSLFHKSIIRKALANQYLPILIFPEMIPARYFLKHKELKLK